MSTAIGVCWELAKCYFAAAGLTLVAAGRWRARLGGLAICALAAVLVVGSVAASLAYMVELDGDAATAGELRSARQQDIRVRLHVLDGQMTTLSALAAEDQQRQYRRRALSSLSTLDELRQERGALSGELAELLQGRLDGDDAAPALAAVAGLMGWERTQGALSRLKLWVYGIVATALELVGIAAIAMARYSLPALACGRRSAPRAPRPTPAARGTRLWSLDDVCSASEARAACTRAESSPRVRAGSTTSPNRVSFGSRSLGTNSPHGSGPSAVLLEREGERHTGVEVGSEETDVLCEKERQSANTETLPAPSLDPRGSDDASTVMRSSTGSGRASSPNGVDPAAMVLGVLAEKDGQSSNGVGANGVLAGKDGQSTNRPKCAPAVAEVRTGRVVGGHDGGEGCRQDSCRGPAGALEPRLAAARDLILSGDLRPTYRGLRERLHLGQEAAQTIMRTLLDEGVVVRQGRRYVGCAVGGGGAARREPSAEALN